MNTDKSKKTTTYVALLTVIAVVAGTIIIGLSSSPQTSETTTASQTQADSAIPTNGLSPTDKVSMTLQTNQGEIVIETIPDKALITVNALTAIADAGFYNGNICHRLTTEGIFVVQCGDPEADGPGGNPDGVGGPGFALPDENLPEAVANNYPAGTVAMANAGPGTGGSQFFLVYQDTTLGPNYTIWGNISAGLDILQNIAAQGVLDGGTDGPLASGLTIESVAVSINQ